MSNHGRFITMDFETRSAQTIKVGPWKYSEHPTTYPLCLSYVFGMDEEVHLWNAATEGIEESARPDELLRLIEAGWLVEAHNAMFERAMWFNLMVKKWRWPEVRKEQWRCTAARAAYHCLPRKLEDLALVLELRQQKDPVGKSLIKALSMPEKIKKAEKKHALKDIELCEALGTPSRYFWAEVGQKVKKLTLCKFNEDPVLIRQNWEYCKQDTRTEREAGNVMPPMPDRELRVWQMDQEMNARGVRADLPMARAAIKMAKAEVEDLNARLRQIVPNVDRASQRAKVLEWMQLRAGTVRLHIPDTTADTLDKVLKRPNVPEDLREVIDIMRKVNRSSIAKYQAMIDQACDDERMRDLLMYAGAHTLRWTARNVQPHNFPRGGIKYIETAADVIKEGDREWARFLYGDVMELLSHSLRGALISGKGKKIWVADFAAIEARVVFWLSQCAAALAVFERGEDIYCTLASRIYGRTITKADANERQLGKQSILGLGFGMGFCKFLITLRKYNIKFTKEEVLKIVEVERYNEIMEWLCRTDKWGGNQYVTTAGLSVQREGHELVLTKFIVDLYRTDFPEVPAFWKQQERSAILAVETKKAVQAGLVTWEYLEGPGNRSRLVARLPSGTVQTYWDPKVTVENDTRDFVTNDNWAKFDKEKLAKNPKLSSFDLMLLRQEQQEKNAKKVKKLNFHGLDEKTRQWLSHHTYGGELTENLVQHLARDIMADAMVRIEDHPIYQNVLSVHDEEVAESGSDEGDKHEFEELVKRVPSWAPGCPVDAEGWVGTRYKKA